MTTRRHVELDHQDVRNVSRDRRAAFDHRTVGSPQGAWLEVDGKQVLNLCSNNYLGLANNYELKQAAITATKQYGVGTGAVRTISGNTVLHQELERELAKFKSMESALLFQSGYMANLGVLGALAGPEDVVISDELNHASIIDGCRLSRASIIRYAHADPVSLADALSNAPQGKRCVIVTDGVFSMDGDVAPLPDIAELADRHDALLVVDDAHGEGVLGRGGRGIVDHFGLHGAVDVEIGTMSKALGVIGGYACASRYIIDILSRQARPFLFSGSPTPADTAANISAVQALDASDDVVKALWKNTSYFRARMMERGVELLGETPIVPVLIRDPERACQVADHMFDQGVFVVPVTYPTVPMGLDRIRAMVSASHSRVDLDRATEAFVEAMKAS